MKGRFDIFHPPLVSDLRIAHLLWGSRRRPGRGSLISVSWAGSGGTEGEAVKRGQCEHGAPEKYCGRGAHTQQILLKQGGQGLQG